jgi:phage terminase small subunit
MDEIDGTDPLVESTIEQSAPAPKPGRRLTLKQRAFIDNYTDSQNADTYSNGTQSVLAIKGRKGSSYMGAAVQANEYLNSPKMINEIESRAIEAGLTDMFRLSKLFDIAQGQYVTKETSQRIVKGKVRTVTTLRTPKASEVVKAIDTANKMVGQYEKNRVMANAVSLRFRELAKAYKPKLESVQKSIQVKVKSKHSQTMGTDPYCMLLPCMPYCPTTHDSEPTAHDDSAPYAEQA